MDKFDHRSIDLLRHNARLSVTEIAPNEGVSICAYFSLKFDKSTSTYYCESYADELYQIDGVKWCHAISGETDMMVFVEVANMNRLNEIRDQIQRLPELRHLMTHTVLTEFFNTTANKFVR